MQNINTSKIIPVDNTVNSNIFAHVSAKDIQVRRRDYKNRHGKNGTFHNNKGFLMVGRDPETGHFVSLQTS